MRLLPIFAAWTIGYFGLVYCSGICSEVVEVKGIKSKQRIRKFCCPGYERIKNTCRPTCEPYCINSKCIAPNKCKCNRGYEPVNSFRCNPTCYNCTYGFCLAPGMCECYRGYEWNTTRRECVPSCDPPCVNGYCSDRNFCVCYDGYHISKDNLFICVKNGPHSTTTTSTTAEASTPVILDSTSWVGRMKVKSSSSYEASSSSEDTQDTSETSSDKVEESSAETSAEDILAVRFQTTTRIPETSGFGSKDSNVLHLTSFGIDYVSTGRDVATEAPKFELTTVEDDTPRTSANTETSPLPILVWKKDQEGPIAGDDSYFTKMHDERLDTTRKPPPIHAHTTEFYDKDVLRSYIAPGTGFYLLYVLLSVFVVIAILFLVYLLSERYHGKEYNIARLEKRKGVVKYSAEQSDVITAW